MFRNSQSAVDRREMWKQEEKIELPLNVDTRKYLLSFLRYRDIIISLPLLVLGIIILYFLKTLGAGINVSKILYALAPWLTFLIILTVQHPERKNISFFQYKIVWKLKFNKRQKLFVYKGGRQMDKNENEKDIRDILGITNIHSDCYETTDRRFVKVIKVSSINISLLSNKDKKMIFNSYETFLNDLPKNASPQINQIAQPVNLKNYSRAIKEKTAKERDKINRLLIDDYLNFVDEIQQSRNMVSRNRYVILSKSFTLQNREKALEQLDRDVNIVKSQIENMFSGQFQLNADVLNNEELFNLYYTCIDYENAQVNSSLSNEIHLPITLGEKTYKEMSIQWAEEKNERIL